MINREVSYERNLTGSFLKIPAAFNGEFDEKLMLRKKIKGLAPVEQCFFNGQGQYWYNISGMQSLDMYCHIKPPEYGLIEKMIISLCDEAELLEKNLIAPECLLFDPEFIFLSPNGEEFVFLIYPGNKSNGIAEMQQLMDYILTRIDHTSAETVSKTYALYELIRKDELTIRTLKAAILAEKERLLLEELPIEEPQPKSFSQRVWKKAVIQQPVTPTTKKKPQLTGCWEKIKEFLFGTNKTPAKPKKVKTANKAKNVNDTKVYGSNTPEEKPEDDFQTICIALREPEPEGILFYEGNDGLNDIIIGSSEQKIGNGRNADVRIDKETISHVHARILMEEGAYYIEDLNSTNGTYINDIMLSYKEKRRLNANDIVRFADIKYRFV